MNDLSLEKFDPTEAQLLAVVEQSKSVDVSIPEQVKEVRFKLRDYRLAITSKGKELREDAVKFQKDVIAQEKKLLSIISPTELEFEKLYEANKLQEAMKKREVELPQRKAALETIQDGVEVTDEYLLTLDDNKFNEYRLQRLQNKIEADRREAEESRVLAEREEAKKREADNAKILEEKKKLDEERAELEKEKARIDGIKAERERAEEENRKKEERERAEEARIEAEKKDNEAKETLKTYLKSIGFQEGDDVIKWEGSTATIWRKIGGIIL